MEAVKNGLSRLGRNAGPLVVDTDEDFIPDTRDGDFDEAAWGREAHCVVDYCVQGAGEAVGLTHDDRAVLARPGEGDARIAGLAACFPAVDGLVDQRAKVDRTEVGSGQFRIGPRGFA